MPRWSVDQWVLCDSMGLDCMPLTNRDDPKDLQRLPFDIEAFVLLAKEKKKKKGKRN